MQIMKYAIYLPNFGPFGDARALAELAREAEQAGWDGFFIWDHIVPADWWPEPMVDSWIALAAIAMNTTTIRIGTTVTPLPRRRPWKVARETVSLDRLSSGRMILGVGTGGGEQEWDNLGEETDPKVRGAKLDEALAILDLLWSGEKFSYNGEHYHITETQFLPTPIQQHIPVWVGGFWPNKAPFKRAAKRDGVFPLFNVQGPEEVDLLKEVAAYVRAQRGDDKPFDVVYTGCPVPKPGDEGAAELVKTFADAGVTWWLECLIPVYYGGDWSQGWKGEWPVEAMRERVRLGPPTR
jgi:probable F420-dependent oxidoreductase